MNAEYREVVERRVYTVTGQHADEEQIEKMIETGESETIFQKAILEQVLPCAMPGSLGVACVLCCLALGGCCCPPRVCPQSG